MAITKVRSYNSSPYFDDYDETDNFHRVLFRPGYAVQARELTQLQTALQGQIDKFGQYNFKDGSRVVGGKVTLNTEYDFIKLTNASFTHSSTTYNSTYQSDNLANFVGTTITGTSNTGNQVTAKVLEAVAATGSDPHTLYISYENSGDTNRNVAKFVADEVVTSSGGTTYYAKVGASGVTPIGQGSRVSIEEGAYFISGCFAYVAANSLILDKYTNTPSYTVALKVDELLVAADDVTHDAGGDLNDNATGTPNFAAPGANRYKIYTTLVKDNLVPTLSGGSADTYTRKITLLTVENGITKVDETDKTHNTELTARLARRTHEESGDYAIRPFTLDLREHKLVGNNGGYLAGGSLDKVAIGIEPSVAYVKGYRIENLATNYIPVNKPRGATDYIKDNVVTSINNVGNYVKCAASAIDGIPDISTFKTVQLKNGSNAVIGTARIRDIEYISAAEVRLYLFDISMGTNSFGDVTNMVQGPVSNSGTNFIVSALTSTSRFDSGNDGLVFKLPRNAIKTLKDGSDIETIYTIRERFAGTLSGSQTVAVSITDGLLANNTDMVITLGANDPVTTTSQAMPAANGTSFTLNCTGMTGASNGAEIQIVYSVLKAGNTNSKLKSKTKETITGQTITANGSASYGLGRADAIELTTITDVNGSDIKDKFVLDTGQTDSFYDESKIILKGGEVVPNGAMTVAFKYWSHGSGDYFTVDSYPSADYVDIPSFSGKQGAVELRDCVDFRPTKGSGSPTTGNEFGTGTGPDTSGCPLPGSIMINDITYYLPRIDKVYINRDGEFNVVEGVAAKNPAAPEDPEDAMVIYKLNLNPYVYKLSDVVPTMIDNKRYTMRDIGKIDKRVKNLEYYTSLSLLEKEAADTQIFDSAGNTGDQRFKNGFIVDGFYGHDRGNVTHPDYNVAIDRRNGILRPKASERNVNLIRKAGEANGTTSGSTTYAKKGGGGIVTMPYTESAYITQPYSSYAEFVNPYNVFSWSGEITLSPESDEWKETEIRPDVIVNDTGLYDQLVQQAEASGILGTVWNEWETNWSGSDDSVETFETDGWGGISTTTITTTTTTTSQTQTGFQTTAVPDTILKDMGSRVVEINFVPFIRSRKIWFKAELMKPNTKVYAFFNGQNVTTYCDDGVAFSEWSDASAEPLFYDGATVSDTGDGVLTTDATGQCTGSFIIPRNDALKIKTGTRLFRLTDSSTNDKNNETTSAEGLYHAQGLLEVSENVIVATKVPKFVTSEISDNRIVESTSVNTQSSIARTRWADPLAQTFICDTQGGVFATSVKIYVAAKDANLPVTVSIRSVENGTPTQKVLPGASVNVYPGSITTSVDASVATTVTFDHPVYLSPDQEYAIVLMSQSDDYKVYVAEMGGDDLTNTSYKITKQPYNGVFFTSQNASTWTPEQTKDLKFILNTADFTDLKDPQDHSATLTLVNDVVPTVKLGPHPFQFLSHPNGTTVRVRVLHKNHGMYDQTAPGRVTITGAVTTNGVAASALNATHIIRNNSVDHDSYEVDITEQATSVATDGSIFGGGTAVVATTNNMYNTLYPIIQNVQVPGTSIKWFLTGYSGKSMDGAEADYAAQTEVQILANGNNNFTNPMVIASAINETNSMSGAKSFTLRCVLSHNGNTNVSPIIDMNRSSAVLIENIVNDATTNSSAYTTRGTYVAETAARNTSNFSKYVTKKVELNNEAEVLDVYINANKPDGGNVDLYYKVAADNAVFDDQVWIIASPENTILTDNSNTFREVHYEIDPAGVKFDAFAFKIVLRSTNSSNPPMVKDFRAIAST